MAGTALEGQPPVPFMREHRLYQVDFLLRSYGFALDGLDATAVLEAVAKKRGCILKGRGGELDLEKAAMILLTDYRSGTLGRISLETPATRQAMLAAAASKPKKTAAPKPGAAD